MRRKPPELSLAFTQRLLATCPDFIYVLDLEAGRAVWRNRPLHEALGYEADELEAPDAAIPQQLLHADDRRDPAALLGSLRLLGPGEVTTVEFRMWDRQRRLRHFRSRITPLETDAHGQAGLVLGSITDVSQQKWADAQAEAALAEARRASAAKNEFLAHMSHEIRTPLHGIVGSCSLLLGTGSSPEQREYIQAIVRSGEALRAVVDDVLDWSKIEAGRLEVQHAPFALLDVVEDALGSFTGEAARKGVGLALRWSGELPATLVGDGARVRQILLNYLSNAVKFTDAGRITVEAWLAAGRTGRCRVGLAVTDTGPGIAEAVQAQLFGSYVQGRQVVGAPRGTGLGLAICRQLAGLMGGEAGVASQEGAGSRFWVELELALPDGPVRRQFPRQRLAGRRVALVTDDWHGAEGLRQALVDSGADVALVAPEASPMVRRVDVVIFDRHHVSSPVEALMARMPGTSSPRAPGATASRAAAVVGLKPLRIAIAPVGAPLQGLLAQKEALALDLCLAQPPSLRRLHDFLIEGVGATLADSCPLPEREGRERPKILVVDDNEENLAVLSRMIEVCGYAACVAAGGREAIEACVRERPALVLMDCRMPVVDGYQATRALRARGISVPIVALTADCVPSVKAQCAAAGMNDVITKPLRLEDLRTRLGDWLEAPTFIKEKAS